MDSNPGAKDSSQDSKCTELDDHARQLSPMANWSHTGLGLLNLVQPDPNSTPTAGNTLHLICFLNKSEDNNSPPSDTAVGTDPSFPSVINDISSIRNTNHHLSSELNSSDADNAHDAHDAHNAHDVAATDKNDDVCSISNRSRLSARSIAHSLAATMKDGLLGHQ